MSRILTPSPATEAASSVAFRRFLAMWAQDCLRLSRSGLTVPTARKGQDFVMPRPTRASLERPAEERSMIRWMPEVPAAARV
ncbi:MAG: hypothetical protein KF678_01410 [Phycisphaeraceae bacterium]|nr:hypothetical protein [Phycisphaeraceae bacterium]